MVKLGDIIGDKYNFPELEHIKKDELVDKPIIIIATAPIGINKYGENVILHNVKIYDKERKKQIVFLTSKSITKKLAGVCKALGIEGFYNRTIEFKDFIETKIVKRVSEKKNTYYTLC